MQITQIHMMQRGTKRVSTIVPYAKRRKYSVARISRPIRSRNTTIYASYEIGDWTQQVTLNTGMAVTARLANFASAGSYTSIFDQFKFDWIELQLVGCSGWTSGGTLLNTRPYAYVVKDYDDSTVPTNLSYMLNYDNVRIIGPERTYRIRCIPRTQGTAYSGGGASNALSRTGGWFNTSVTNIDFFGFKGLMPPSPIAGNYLCFRMVLKAKITFQNSK